MRTSKPFATISYNSVDFLKSKLDDYKRRGIISFFAFIKHYAEEDEKKDHIHLFIVPDGLVNTSQFSEDLKEIDINNLKPLGIMPIKSSRFSDWYLYSIHNADYLASKGQSRVHHYSNEDFITSDFDYFLEEIHTIDFSKFNKIGLLKDAIKNGIPFEQLVFNGQIPIQQFRYLQEVYNYIFDLIGNSGTYRNSRNNHEIEDLKTGEIIKIKKSSDSSPDDD